MGEVRMTTADLVTGRPGGLSSLWRRQLGAYPNTVARVSFLAITVLATIMLYWELYVGGSVSTLILQDFGMSFTFFVTTLAIGNLIGAFGSLFAGLTDRLGRANMVVFGLLFTGVFTAFVLPAAPNKWVFTIEGFVVGVVEGICLVATPALIRDFSPQVGRATAMGFWTSGPVLGSLVVFLVGSATVPALVTNAHHTWTHEYLICGLVGIVVFFVAFIGLRELSPQLRDQLMVTMHDRALIEMRAKGLDIESALRRPFRQLIKPDVVISAFAVSIMLLIYYTAVGFAVIYITTMFLFSVHQADALGNWNWGFNAVAVILIGVVSDRFRVRKPFMIIGGVGAAAMVVVYLEQAGHHPSYYTLAWMLALLSFALGIAYTPWMASFTETVEDHNPALIATGLAIWGWIIRIVVSASFFVIPHVVTSVTPLVDNGAKVASYAKTYAPEIAFAKAHPNVIAIAQKDAPLAALATGPLAPEIAVIQKNPALFAQLGAPGAGSKKDFGKLLSEAIKLAGGGQTGVSMLEQIKLNSTNLARIGAANSSGDFAIMKQYQTQLLTLQKDKKYLTYLQQNAPGVIAASTAQVAQWKRWYWVCFGGIVFFLLSVPLLRGRWSPRAARRDEAEHEAMVDAELASLRA
jgi:MFS transporter, ACS family, D-galactonate transporter